MLSAGYSGFREGNFLSLVRVLERDVERHFKMFANQNPAVLISRLEKSRLLSRILDVITEAAAQQQLGELWFDKTGNPEMIEAIPRLRTVWPDAVFIFAKRRGIENVLSRLKKFPGHTFEYHCRDWAQNMSAWQFVREQLGDQGIEIDQQEIIRKPEATAGRLVHFLGLPAEARRQIYKTFTNNRPEQTSIDSATRVVTLDNVGWDPEQRSTFLRLCVREMEFFRYSFTDDYWLNSSREDPSELF